MAVVYRARDLRMDRLVALKVLHERASPERLARLRREGQLTANLQHPGIVRIHSAGDLDGQPWLAYEVVEGARTLDQAVEGLGLRERVCLVREVAAAIGHAHEHGVIHRDIKAENVLVDVSGRARVIDFGIAYQDQAETLSKTGGLLGTPFAMAPEQFGRGRVGPPADVWALGVLLYEALTGEQPFAGESLLQLAAQVEAAEVTPPSELSPEVPPELSVICLSCLQREPEDRYPNAGSLALDLEAWLAGRAISRSSGHGARARLARRGAPGLVLAGVLVGAVAWVWIASSGRDPDLEAQALLERGGTSRGRAAIADLLESKAGRDLSPASRGALHLCLAQAEARDEREWRACLEHARAAQESPGTHARGRLREAECWRALELPGRAEAILEEVSSDLPSESELWLELAECHVETGRAGEALAALAQARGADLREAWVVRARAQLSLGAREEVARALKRTRGPEAALVQADWAWGHQDVESSLRTAVANYPGSIPLRRVLAEHLLRVDAPLQAAECLAGLEACRPDAELLRALPKAPLATLRELAPRSLGWRRPAIRFLLRDATRHLGTRDRSAGAKRRAHFSELARAALEKARGLAEVPFTELARVAELERRLEAGAPPRDEAARAAAQAEFDRVRERQRRPDRTAAGLQQAYEGVLEIDPSFEEARYMAAAADLLARGSPLHEVAGLLGCVRREPRLSSQLHADTQRAFVTARYRGREGATPTAREPLAAAFLIVLRLEVTGDDVGDVGRALGLLDGVLESDPDHPLALATRGFVLLRLGRLERAELDLDRVRLMAPGCGLSAFYRLLLWAKQGRSRRDLLRELRYVDSQGFHTWRMRWWNPSVYPELTAYLDDPKFALLKGGSEKQR